MNNSKLSVATSSADAFTAPQTCVYPPSWNNSSDTPLQPDQPLQNGCYEEGTAGTVCTEATSGHDIGSTQAIEPQPWLEAERPDLGLWLLYGSSIRHDQWERLRGTPLSVANTNDFSVKYSSDLVKRFCDVAGSLFLSIALFPLFLLIAILIKLDSSGPVFFRHYRVGKNGRPFVLWKFRSMRAEVPKYEASPRSAVDARLTRVGRLIRRMSVDEMPQLINVLRGEMSLVGPRPEMPFIVARYHPVVCERLAVRPGITGLWQISPARAFPIHENLQYDLHYIRNQNVFLDCAIIVRTITAVIHGVGAV
jgi:lipopolysaccharide/colanic/teichoic acid biosynthesis glycosyltransferase